MVLKISYAPTPPLNFELSVKMSLIRAQLCVIYQQLSKFPVFCRCSKTEQIQPKEAVLKRTATYYLEEYTVCERLYKRPLEAAPKYIPTETGKGRWKFKNCNYVWHFKNSLRCRGMMLKSASTLALGEHLKSQNNVESYVLYIRYRSLSRLEEACS